MLQIQKGYARRAIYFIKGFLTFQLKRRDVGIRALNPPRPIKAVAARLRRRTAPLLELVPPQREIKALLERMAGFHVASVHSMPVCVDFAAPYEWSVATSTRQSPAILQIQ